MHEFLLFGQISASRHALVLSALAGLTALQPQALTERHLLFRPTREPGTAPERAISKRATELGIPPAFTNDTFFVQAVGNLAAPPRNVSEANNSGDDKTTKGSATGNVDQEAQIKAADVMAIDDNDEKDVEKRQDRQNGSSQLGQPNRASLTSDFEAYPWMIEFRDTPAVPARGDLASKRAMLDIEVKPDASPLTFLNDLGYRFSSEYLILGHRYTHGNIDIRLLRAYCPASPESSTAGGSTVGGQQIRASPITRLGLDVLSILAGGRQPPDRLESGGQHQQQQTENSVKTIQTLVDPTGTYILHARLMVAEDGNPDVMRDGLTEMTRFREVMRGFVDLEMGERLAMNTRIR